MSRSLLLALAVALGFAAGCSLLTSFDPEGQPCDVGAPTYAEMCQADAGYHCNLDAGLCTKL